MFPDRTLAPDFKVVKSVNLPEPKSHTLDNGIEMHVISIGEQPVIRLECIFEAGSWFEKTPGASYFAIKMLAEGTRSKTSSQISEAFDRLGAFTEMSHNADRVSVVVYCLSRFLPEVLAIVSELISDAAFPEKELKELKNITLQNLRVNKEKNAYLATTEFRAKLFGKEHPYGQSQNENDIEKLSREDIIAHYDAFIRNARFTVVLAGQVDDSHTGEINRFLGQNVVSGLGAPVSLAAASMYQDSELIVERPESVQSSIRMGRQLFNRHHEDYFKMLVTNEILGGYFGSRLMKNIREEKGLTYGISSHLATLKNEGYFMIGTDVKKEFTQQTIDEIRKEIHLLQTEPVGEEELTVVKNFMAGEFAGSLNTAFEVADRQKTLILDKLPADFFLRYIERIHATTSADIMEMASSYLKPEDMTIVIAGGK